MNYTIGDTALLRDIAQSQRGDFLWVLPFVDVDTDGVETETDLTDCLFVMEIFALDGTSLELLEIGSGITVASNIVTVSIQLATYSGWTKGCKYPYYFTYENADGHVKCLFEGKFMLT